MIDNRIRKLVIGALPGIFLYAILELYGGLFIGISISAFLDDQFLEAYNINNTVMVFGVLIFVIRSVIYFLITRWMLVRAFQFSKDLVDRHFEKILKLPPGYAVASDKFLTNITHEVLSLQANGVTPLLFLLSDTISCTLMILVSLIFSWQITITFIIIAMVCVLIWSSISKTLQMYAQKRAASEQKKLKLATSLMHSKPIYSTGNIMNLFQNDFKNATKLNAHFGSIHQTTVQLPRIILESLVVVFCALLVTFGVGLNNSNLIPIAIILRTIPNFQRIFYNIGNIRAAQISKDILQGSENDEYKRVEDFDELAIEQFDDALHVDTCGGRYPKNIKIQRGVTVITGPSGLGKTFLVRSISNHLTNLKRSCLYIPREVIEDETLFYYLCNELDSADLDNTMIDETLIAEVNYILTKLVNNERLSTGERERLLILYLSKQTHEYIFLDEIFLNIPKEKKRQYFKLYSESRESYFNILITHDTEILKSKDCNILRLGS